MEHKELIKTARLAGVSYLVLAVAGLLGFMVLHSKIFDLEDPAKTLINLETFGYTANLRLLFELLAVVAQALAAVWFYKLFRDIHPWAAATLGIWGTVNSVVILISAIAISSAIGITNAPFSTFHEKIIAIQLLGIMITSAWTLGGIFFGLWLIPMGYIVISSERMPIWLGRILILGGLAYILQTFLHATGAKGLLIDLIVLPAVIGEFWMIGYLLSYGIRPAPLQEEKSR